MDHEPTRPRGTARRTFIRLGTTGLLAAQPSLALLAAGQPQTGSAPSSSTPAALRGVRALVFDTFGTGAPP